MIQRHQSNHIAALCQLTQGMRDGFNLVDIMPAEFRFAALWLLRPELLFQRLAQLLIKRVAGRQQDKAHAECGCSQWRGGLAVCLGQAIAQFTGRSQHLLLGHTAYRRTAVQHPVYRRHTHARRLRNGRHRHF